jgi:isovaleryl-CoA dehydrogenase
LVWATEVGGLGLGLGEAAQVVRRLAASCGSTAMVVRMHYSAVAVIEAHGNDTVRRAIAAGEVDSYVWTSRPTTDAAGGSLWLVPADATGLKVGAPFDGLGLRGNSSSPVQADGITIAATAALGADGGGRDIALGVVLPVFQILDASCSLG